MELTQEEKHMNCLAALVAAIQVLTGKSRDESAIVASSLCATGEAILLSLKKVN